MIKLGVSACLLGKNVRYDGGNKFHNLDQYFNPSHYKLIAVCPEVEMGMAIPRPPIQIINDGKIQLVQVDNNKIKLNKIMKSWFNKNKITLSEYAGFILKSKSPSCGNQTTPHFYSNNKSLLNDGYFVGLLKLQNPHVHIIDESSLNDSTQLTLFKNSLA